MQGACAGGNSVGPRDSLREGPEVLPHNPRVWLRAGVRPLPSAGLLPGGRGKFASSPHFHPAQLLDGVGGMLAMGASVTGLRSPLTTLPLSML